MILFHLRGEFKMRDCFQCDGTPGSESATVYFLASLSPLPAKKPGVVPKICIDIYDEKSVSIETARAHPRRSKGQPLVEGWLGMPPPRFMWVVSVACGMQSNIESEIHFLIDLDSSGGPSSCTNELCSLMTCQLVYFESCVSHPSGVALFCSQRV